MGTVRETCGHVAVVLVAIHRIDGALLRPRDPLPMNGLRVRSIACKGIKAFAQQIGGKLPDLETSLPEHLFPQSGKDLRRVQAVAESIRGVLYVRIVDKGAGHIWGFCAAWMWDTVREFLLKEGYTETTATGDTIMTLPQGIVADKGWRGNKQCRMCHLYLIGKAKSLYKFEWL